MKIESYHFGYGIIIRDNEGSFRDMAQSKQLGNYDEYTFSISRLFREGDSRRSDSKARSDSPSKDNNLDFHLSHRLRDSTAFGDVRAKQSHGK